VSKGRAKPINLALQGGGADGAFTWGVLDQLLEEIALAELDEINWTAINTIMLSEGAAIFADLVARHLNRPGFGGG